MARGSQYTWEYRSTPEHLTRPYLIPPIEDDPFFRAHQTGRARREQDSFAVRSVEPSSTTGQARPPRTDAQGRPLSASERRQAAAAMQAAQVQQAAQQHRRPKRPASATGTMPGAPQPRRRRRVGALGCLIPIVIILVIIGSVASPIIEGIIDRLTSDDDSGPATVSDFGRDPSTDEIVEMLGASGDYQNQAFEAYAVISSADGDGTYRAALSGYAPAAADEIEWEAEAVLDFGGDDRPVAGDLVKGEFAFDGDPDAYDPELSVSSWESAEFHDLAEDIVITETGRDNGEIAYDVEITNTADVERTYALDIALVPPEGSEAMAGSDFVSTEPIAGGRMVVVEATGYVFDIGDESIEYVVSDPYRY